MGNRNYQEGSKIIGLPSREYVIEAQISWLLNMMHSLNPYLLGHNRAFEEFAQPAQIDGGVASSAQTTFINVCSRLDGILADKNRWGLEAQDKFYAALEQAQAEQIEFLKQQTLAAKNLNRPSFQLRPTVVCDGFKFLAFYGDITKPGCAIIGQGNTPSEALVDFDKAFDRAPAEQLILAAQEKGVELDTSHLGASEKKNPAPKKKK